MERVVENQLIEIVDYNEKLNRFFSSLTPLQTCVVMGLMSGSGVQELADAYEVDRRVIQDKIQKAKQAAIRVYGTDALKGRVKTKKRFPVV